MSKISPELQVTPIEAGVCCAAMLLHAHGCKQTTARLREELDLGRGGSTLPQLAELFTRRGVPVDMEQAPAPQALALKGAFIASWGSFGFVIVEKVRKDRVVLVDPAIGRRTAPIAEFREQYAGFYLQPKWQDKDEELWTAENLRPGVGSRRRPLRAGDRSEAHGRHRSTPMAGRSDEAVQAPAQPLDAHPRPFASSMRRSVFPLLGVAAMSLLLYLTDIGAPWLMQKFIDEGLRSHNLVRDFAPYILGLSAMVATGYVLRAKFIAVSAVRIGRHASESVLDHLLGLPYRYFDSRQPGELAYRLAGINAIRDMLSDQLFAGLFHMGGMLVYLGYLYYLNPILAGVSTAFVALMLIVLFGSRALFYSAIQNEMSQTGRMQTEQLEAIQSILTIKTRPDRKLFMNKWRTQNEISLSYLARRLMLQGGVNAIIGVLQFSGPFITLIVGVLMWRDGHVSIGTVFGALTVSTLLFATANAIYGSVSLMLTCRTFARRVDDITSTPQDQRGTQKPLSVTPVEVRGVEYRYTKDSPAVLHDVDLRVEAGSTVALVGPTGSGKSTLAKLILGLYAPSAGEVTFNDVPVSNVEPAHLFGKVSFVPQDVTLETATVHDNITLGKTATREQVEHAARLACVHEDIASFPAGYDTMINNLGANLSGGQRQRIALARAILDQPEVLILDEATSALDARTEVDITANLKDLGCTTIVIAHRLASVANADITYVMKDGRIVEQGSHRHLLDTPDSAYRQLFASQLDVGPAPVGLAA